MKQVFVILFIGIMQFMFSCNSGESSRPIKERNIQVEKAAVINTEEDKHYTLDPDVLLKDFMTWYTYTYNNVKLSDDFIGLNTDSVVIEKGDFLHQLATGKFIAIKTMVQHQVPYYKLYKFNSPNADIKGTIKQMALTAIAYYEMEGKELPPFDFTDLNGRRYNKMSTKGKIIIVKCWFIHCVPCVKEFPELNKLVGQYRDRSDMLFVSLARDSKQDLIPFLRTKTFKYAVVPDKEKYMSEELKITEYPTHILVDKSGKIVKVVNTISELAPLIKKQIEKTSTTNL
jgi:thiol-disulfide isomerase/thioredoxin